jgi:sugar (pentulose or hexulose) kinase
MSTPCHIAVIDIGKTNAKLALVDLPSLTEIAVVTRSNTVRTGPPWPHYDVEGHWQFLLSALTQFHADYRVDAISVTTHGACAALLADDGTLAAPILDYEHVYLPEIVAAYDALKPEFAQTGSPKLAGGLNLGAQLHYQFIADPGLLGRTKHIVPYPQYWGHRLTGIAVTDVTSIGCHTDLWQPQSGALSDLPAKLGVAEKIAPMRRPAERLGTILPEIADATGLPLSTPVCVGIHDSNASLYPHLIGQRSPFSVVSTGTWVIAMAIGGSAQTLDPARDTLINVDANGDAVPSARFMGGREFELIQQGRGASATRADVAEVIARGLMLLPAVEPSCGPFPGQQMRWVGDEPALGSPQRSAALALYLALMTGTCLSLIGGEGPTIVEGPFAQNEAYLHFLATTTGRPVWVSAGRTGTSVGAALLFGTSEALAKPYPISAAGDLPGAADYVRRWRCLSTKSTSFEHSE